MAKASKTGVIGAAALLGVVSLLGGGCRSSCDSASFAFNPEILSDEHFGGACQAGTIFSPGVARDEAPTAHPLPPMANFNSRPTWPAVAGYHLGEITFYRERYYDRQASYTSGSNRIYDSTQRNFDIYRTGVYVR